jgi:hypothetical protein
VDFDAGIRKPAGVEGRVTVGAEHADAAARERECRRLPRAREADDEDAVGKRQRRKNVKSR